MYFVLEFKDEPRKMVKAKRKATMSELVNAAFGFGIGSRTKEVRLVGAFRRLDVAQGAMCKVWPSGKSMAEREGMAAGQGWAR